MPNPFDKIESLMRAEFHRMGPEEAVAVLRHSTKCEVCGGHRISREMAEAIRVVIPIVQQHLARTTNDIPRASAGAEI